MAVTAQSSDFFVAQGVQRSVRADFGKMRAAVCKHTQSGAGDATSTVELVKLPPGLIRVIPALSRVSHSAFGASRTLAIGHRLYKKDYIEGDVAEDPDAFVAALDVSAAGAAVAFNTALEYDFYSEGGVTIFATVAGGTIPAAATLELLLMYIQA